ncbi:hypothetical protein [Peribacillus phoenicis]
MNTIDSPTKMVAVSVLKQPFIMEETPGLKRDIPAVSSFPMLP